jgi:hypothetical protein
VPATVDLDDEDQRSGVVPRRAQSQWLRPGPASSGLGGRLVYSGRARASQWARPHLRWLNRIHAWLTVRDLFGSPGDTLLTAIVCRHLKQNWPGLRLNCITKNPDLLLHDPHLSALNRAPGLFGIDFWYLDLVERRDNTTNVLVPTLASLGVDFVDYRAHVYLTPAERDRAEGLLAALPHPRVAFNQLSAQSAKNWPRHLWEALLPALRTRGSLVHLGDRSEPVHEGVTRLAGQLSRRESMAALAECDVFVGPVSFLMHAASGVNVPAAIIFGGQHSPAVAGYAANRNLYTDIACSGCWLSSREQCPHNLMCLELIGVDDVLDAVDELLVTGDTLALPD